MPLLDTDQDLARDSYYAATAVRGPGHAPLAGTASCDVAVVGGGLAGLSAALELRQRGLDVVLLESQQLAWGGSGRNGGQAIHGLACDQGTIEAQLGLDEARRVWAMTIEALDLIRERIARHGIACDWRDGFLGLATNARKGAELAAWADRIESVYGYPLTRVAPADLRAWIDSPRFHSGIHDPRSGHLHPLKYSLGIARAAAEAGVRLHEHSAVTSMTPGETVLLRTAGGELRARQVLLAGNVYLSGLAPALEPRIMPVGTYIACSSVLDDALADRLIPSRSAVCDTNFVLDYFRTTDDNRMLYGGRVSYSTVTPANLAESMRQRMVLSFPQLASAQVDYAWGGFVDISMNRAPDFGRLPAAPNVYYLQGFSGHGLALTGMAGRLVAEAMAGDAARFDVFARLRHRPFPGGRMLRTPALVLGMAWYRLRDILG
ncbi:FAD-dependent oxidoreductase [Rubrivivax gelatinosus]|nr:FAD-dependent oxidoreductase [Rubrivivax gelatinosus]